jgi:hypothetical protein
MKHIWSLQYPIFWQTFSNIWDKFLQMGWEGEWVFCWPIATPQLCGLNNYFTAHASVGQGFGQGFLGRGDDSIQHWLRISTGAGEAKMVPLMSSALALALDLATSVLLHVVSLFLQGSSPLMVSLSNRIALIFFYMVRGQKRKLPSLLRPRLRSSTISLLPQVSFSHGASWGSREGAINPTSWWWDGKITFPCDMIEMSILGNNLPLMVKFWTSVLCLFVPKHYS